MFKATIEDGQVVFRVPLQHVVELNQEREPGWAHLGADAPMVNTVIVQEGSASVTVQVDSATMKALVDAVRGL